MAGDLDGAYISGMPLRANVVVLHDACRVEIVDERLRLLAHPRGLLGDTVVDDGVPEVLVRVEPVHGVRTPRFPVFLQFWGYFIRTI